MVGPPVGPKGSSSFASLICARGRAGLADLLLTATASGIRPSASAKPAQRPRPEVRILVLDPLGLDVPPRAPGAAGRWAGPRACFRTLTRAASARRSSSRPPSPAAVFRTAVDSPVTHT